MKKIFTLFAVVAMAITASAQEAPQALWLDFSSGTSTTIPTITDPYTGEVVTEPDGLEWANGCKMYLAKYDASKNTNKKYAKGNSAKGMGQTIKLSNGAANYLVLPEGFTTNTIEVYGYCNSNGATSWIADVSVPNGDALESVYKWTEGDATLPNDPEGFKGMTLENMPKLTLNLSKPVSGAFWFKNGGKQPAVYINILPYDSTSAIENITVDENAPVEYYNLQGVRVANPESGLYIRKQGNTVTKVVL